MKNVAIGVILMMCSALTIQAQDTPPAKQPLPQEVLDDPNPALRMGLSLSPLISWFSTEGDPSIVYGDGVRFGVQYGLHMDFRLGANPNYYFATGLFMLQTGGTIRHPYVFTESDGTNVQVTREALFRLNYVNVPLNVMLRTNEIGYIRYFARVGFDLGFKVKANMDITDYNRTSSEIVDTRVKADANDITNLFRTALHLEAGVEYNMGETTRMVFSAEWNNGLNNVFNSDYRQLTVNESGAIVEGDRIRAITNVLALKVGVYF
jgi:hypothetical protein